MSFRHVEILKEVREEFEAVRGCAKHALGYWTTAAADLDPIKFKDVDSAVRRLEVTYIVRLTAAFEAITYIYLLTDRSRSISDKASGIELTNPLSGSLQDGIRGGRSHLNRAERSQIANIKKNASDARKLLRYRNKIAHRGPPQEEEFTFKESLSTLNRLLALIP